MSNIRINFNSDTARIYGIADASDVSYPLEFPNPIRAFDPSGGNFSVMIPGIPTGFPIASTYGEWFLEYSTSAGDTKFIPGCKVSRRIGGKKRPLTRYFKDMRGAETGSWFNEYRVKHNNCLPPPPL